MPLLHRSGASRRGRAATVFKWAEKIRAPASPVFGGVIATDVKVLVEAAV